MTNVKVTSAEGYPVEISLGKDIDLAKISKNTVKLISGDGTSVDAAIFVDLDNAEAKVFPKSIVAAGEYKIEIAEEAFKDIVLQGPLVLSAPSQGST